MRSLKLPAFCLFSLLAFCLFSSWTSGGDGSTDIFIYDLLPEHGFKIIGKTERGILGWKVSTAGDLNGDGIHDLVLSSGDRKEVFVLFGKKEGFPLVIVPDAEPLDGRTGFKIQGGNPESLFGTSISSGGDVNGDGIDDLIIAEENSSPLERENAGIVYVIFGSKQGFPAVISANNLSSQAGFKIIGSSKNDLLGSTVSNGGDLNGDGVDDIVIGAQGGNDFAGEVYVIFGRKNGFESVIDLRSFSSSEGFKISGVKTEETEKLFGRQVQVCRDMNGDGIDDLIIVESDDREDFGSGIVYVIFGRKTGFASFVISDIPSGQGFKIVGEVNQFYIEETDGRIGDVNGDGLSDIAVGGSFGDIYILFGRRTGFPDTIVLQDRLPKDQGFKLTTSTRGHINQVDISGDVNGDGLKDIIVGSFKSPNWSYQPNVVYILFGRQDGFESVVNLDSLSIDQGYRILGTSQAIDEDSVGGSVSSSGDINGDGIADLIVSAEVLDPRSRFFPGAIYVIYGHKICRDRYLNWDHTCVSECAPSFESILNGQKYCSNPEQVPRSWEDTNIYKVFDYLVNLL